MPCPIDFASLTSKLIDFHKLTQLPWTPLYTQEQSNNDGNQGPGGDDNPELSITATHAMALTVLFTIFVFSLEHMLDERQALAYKSTTFPSLLEETVGKIDEEDKTKTSSSTTKNDTDSDDATEGKTDKDAADDTKLDKDKPILPQLKDKFQKAQAYGRDKISFGMISSFYGTMESVAFLLLGFLPYTWDMSVKIGSSYFGWNEQENEIKISLIFLLLTTIVGTVTSLPFEIYSTFQIEKKHGFNKQTPSLFVTDKIKSLVLMCLIGGPFTAALLKIIKVRMFVMIMCVYICVCVYIS
jgi:STE24 endopeptidase